MKPRSVLLGLLSVLFALPALAQDTAEAKGRALDSEGKPVVGVEVVFTNIMPPHLVCDAKTDKKGYYYMSNLLHYPADKNGNGIWQVQVKAEGYTTAKLKIESRRAGTGGRKGELLGDPYETKITLGGKPAEVKVSGLGEITVDFTLLKEQVQAASPPGAAAPGSAAAAPAPEDPWEQAQQRLKSGDLDGAREALQKAVEAKPDEFERRQLLAYVFFRQDRMGEAEQQASKALALAPDKPGSNIILAEIYKAKGDNEKAWDALQKERALAPENVRVLERIAALGAEMDRTDDAIAAAEAVSRINPSNADAWVSLGTLYEKKGEHEKSEQAFRKVVDLDPAHAAQTFYNIGAVIANKPDLSEADNKKAIEALRKAVGLKADYGAAHRELGFALLRSNDREGARKELEAYLSIDPGAPDAGEIRSMLKTLKK